MPFSITVNLGNTVKLDAFAKQLLPKTIKTVQNVFNSALPIVKSNERVNTGNMVNKTVQNSLSNGAIITAQAGYSGFQNFGTRYMSGTHFMEGGLNAISQSLETALVTELSII